jgi:hypothetical protein
MRALATILFALFATTGISGSSAVAASPTPERPGCCSHHGGVCGCSNGTALCCDRTLSPTCGC